MTREQLMTFASQAGFGGQQRNTLAVKLELLEALLKKAHFKEAEEMGEVALLKYNRST